MPDPGVRTTADLLRPVWKDKPRTIACHRADLAGHHVPNSLTAVQECVAARAPRIEVDVAFLRDDTMAILHGANLSRDTTGEGEIGSLDLDDLRHVTYRQPPHPPVALLHEVVEALSGSDTILHVDLKAPMPMSAARMDALVQALAPLNDGCLVGTQSHWNLLPLARRGIAVAIDTTQQWHYWPGRPANLGLSPTHLGLHGLWDDAPLAQIVGVDPIEYVNARLNDLAGLVPSAVEWMVDLHTIRQLARLGVALGDALHDRGIELAAWTIEDRGPETTRSTVAQMFDLGADTVIANRAAVVAGYLGSLD